MGYLVRIIACAILGVVSAGSASAAVVDCTAGEKISDALKGKGKSLVILGDCFEDDDEITVRKDDVELKGHPSGGTFHGRINVDGAQRVVIENLTITAPLDGIWVLNGASALIQDNDISNNDEELGVFVGRGAYARIENNIISSNAEVGISIHHGSARGESNTVSGHSGSGVEVHQHGQYSSNFDVISDGYSVSRNSYSDLRGVTVNGNITLSFSSMVQIRHRRGTFPTVNGSVIANALSVAHVKDAPLGEYFGCLAFTGSLCQ